MKKKLLSFIAAVFCCVGFAFAADPVEGCWISVDEKTGKDTAGWIIYTENGKLFGKMLSAHGNTADSKADKCTGTYKDFPVSGSVASMTMLGTPFIYNLTSTGNGKWANGYIINPEDGKLYTCKITFHKAGEGKYKTDTLEMRGEIGLGIGRSQFWRKATQDEASSVQ